MTALSERPPRSVADPAVATLPSDTWFTVGSDRVRLLRDGERALPAMWTAIEAAREEVLLEMYWVGDDAVGRRFRDALRRAAQRGVRVLVIYDSVGSLGLPETFFRPLEEAGGHVHEYHALSPLRPSFDLNRLEERDHRKLLVTDSARGFTGGVNLARPWSPEREGGDGWRDDVIEVVGHAARELRTLFYKTWRRVHRAGLRAAADMAKRALLTHQARPDLRPRDLVTLPRRPTSPVYVLASQRRSKRSIGREYLGRIRSATRSIEIANSYFLPDRGVRHGLYRAAARGVRVRVLVPERSDVAVVQYATESLFDELLRRGVEVYAMPGPMMHAKTAVIDDAFATIGSYNLDARSRQNLEVNVAVEDPAFARHVRSWFDHDVASAKVIDLFEWRARSLTRRGAELAAYALRRLL
jgi:cardiolipin synthase A/B